MRNGLFPWEAKEGESPLDGSFVSEIRRIGFHPFVLVRVGELGDDPKHEFRVCLTQNEAPQFVDEIAALPGFERSLLLRGIERALQIEIYDAAGLLFRWVKGEGLLKETLYLGLAEGLSLDYYAGYPAFGYGNAAAPYTPRARIRLLTAAFEAYRAASGNDHLRWVLVEALGLALSRAVGSFGEYDEAARIVDAALGLQPYSIHLKSAKHALALALAGEEIAPRLVKFIGEDNGYLERFVCHEPFDRFDIGPSGDVLVCCGHWLPTSIGNLMRDSVDDVLNSPRAQQIRQSVTDGTFKYCNHLECGAMAQAALPLREEVRSSRARHALSTGEYSVSEVDQILFAFDRSCNLSCPSCRRERITERASDSEDKARTIEEKLVPLLPRLKQLNLNPAGELFASKPSRKLLELIDDQRCPDLMIDIISNGTLFSEEEWNKFPGIHGKVRSVRISTDAAKKATFEKLRRLGRYEIFMENILFLGRLRGSGAINELNFSFTYQKDNMDEIWDFILFAEQMNGDFIIFERLQNLGAFTDEEYRERAVHHETHRLYSKFIQMISDPIFRQSRSGTIS